MLISQRHHVDMYRTQSVKREIVVSHVLCTSLFVLLVVASTWNECVLIQLLTSCQHYALYLDHPIIWFRGSAFTVHFLLFHMYTVFFYSFAFIFFVGLSYTYMRTLIISSYVAASSPQVSPKVSFLLSMMILGCVVGCNAAAFLGWDVVELIDLQH